VTLSRVRVAGGHSTDLGLSVFLFFSLEASCLMPSLSLLTYVLCLSFLLSFVLLLLLSLSLTFVWAGYSPSGSIGNPLNPGPESARWGSGQCGLVILYIERPLE